MTEKDIGARTFHSSPAAARASPPRISVRVERGSWYILRPPCLNAGQLGAAGFLAPNLIAARAYALAALERPEEAAAELSQLPLDYFFLDRIRFVVPLVAMLVEGDVDSAGALVAATSSDLAVGPRDELLRDLVRAATSPSGVGASEIARLREELHDRDEDRRWMQRVTPALLDRFDLEQLTAARWQ